MLLGFAHQSESFTQISARIMLICHMASLRGQISCHFLRVHTFSCGSPRPMPMFSNLNHLTKQLNKCAQRVLMNGFTDFILCWSNGLQLLHSSCSFKLSGQEVCVELTAPISSCVCVSGNILVRFTRHISECLLHLSG